MAEIRFCTARDGARLAYAVHGRGPPLVRVATWLTHLELVAAGLTNEATVEQLVLSVRTVERHLSNIYAKLRLSGKAARAGAAVRFMGAHPSQRSRGR